MFNHTTLEQDIERLSREVAEKKNLPEHKETPEREIVKITIQPVIQKAADDVSKTAAAAAPTEESVLPDYLKESPAELKLKVEKLVDVVLIQQAIL